MIRKIIGCGVMVVFALSAAVSPATATENTVTMQQIYAFAKQGDWNALRQLEKSIDVPDAQNQTALCQAMVEQNYRAFRLLTAAGADSHTPCVSQITEAERMAFRENYRQWLIEENRGLSGGDTAKATGKGLSLGAKVGIAAGVVAVGGGIALAAGGGGGGGGSHKKSSSSSSSSVSVSQSSVSSASASQSSSYSSASSASSVSSVSSVSVSSISASASSSASLSSSASGSVVEGCPVNTYGNGSVCFSCPAHSTAPLGAKKISDCQCLAGYTKTSAGTACVPEIGSYQEVSAKTFNTGDPYYAFGRVLPVINAGKAYEKFIRAEMNGSNIVSYDTGGLSEVRVAVMDTGVNAENENINFATENDAVLQFDYANPTGNGYHGTSVASLIAGKWDGNERHINGIAPNARIVDWMIDRTGMYGTSATCRGMTENYLTQVSATGPRIYNLSWSFYGYNKADYSQDEYWARSYNVVPDGQTETTFNLVFNQEGSFWQKFLYNLADTNSVLVLASGNWADRKDTVSYAAEETQLLGAAPLVLNGENGQKDLTNLMIVAVALDLKNDKVSSAADVRGRASYSNGCGAAASYCLSAPVGDIIEPLDINTAIIASGYRSNSEHKYFTGTSAAAPIISGSLAFVMGAYPYLTSQQAVEILFRSANKTIIGADGKTNVFNKTGTWTDSFGNKYDISTTFGHGLVDLGAATDSLGILSVPTTAGGAGASGVIPKVAVSQTKLALPRTLNSNISAFLPESVIGLDDYNRPFAIQTGGLIRRAHRSDDQFRRYFKSFISRNIQTVGDDTDKMTFKFASAVTDKNLLGMGILDVQYAFNNKNTMTFSYRADTRAENKYFEGALPNPFINMTDAYALANRYRLAPRLSVQFGATWGKNGFYRGNEDWDEKYTQSVYALTTGMDYQIKQDLTVRLVGGLLTEKDSSLGINGSGAFETDNSRTYFTGSILEYRPMEKLALSAAYYYGRTETPGTKGLVAFSDILSDGFALDARYSFDERQLAGVQFSSPLRIKKGTATLTLPYARDLYSDTVYYDTARVGLKPDAREYDVGFYYTAETRNYQWRGEIMTRFNPDHIAGLKPDYRALLGFLWKY